MCTSLENLKQQGIQLGIQQGTKQTIEKLLKANFTVSDIARALEVPEETILDIQKEMN
jgi:predicted transposase/invertase (TIGR01784 family)